MTTTIKIKGDMPKITGCSDCPFFEWQKEFFGFDRLCTILAIDLAVEEGYVKENMVRHKNCPIISITTEED